MSDEKSQGVTGAISGWIKALVTSVVGLVSGAILMYLTPLVNNAIKPAKPLSNFAAQVSGLSVNFNNRSTGGVQGWWDFGDGTALEPFDPKSENVKHIYPGPGTYTVKLTLSNLIGEEADRSAPVKVDADTAVAAGSTSGPAIDLFDLKPIDKREVAPAVYKLTSKVKNASYCILSCGDSRPMEVFDAASQERYFTFDEMGAYTIRLAAVNGKQLVEQTKTVYVGASDDANPTAKLIVTYEAVKVERRAETWRIHCGWQGDARAGSSTFRKERLADPGYTIASAELVNKDDKTGSIRNLKADISSDKSKVVLTGELIRPTGMLAQNAAAPHWLAVMKVGMERRSPPQTINRGDIAMAVGMNSTTKIPMQPLEDGYEIIRKQISMQLWDGSRKVWEGSKAIANAPVILNKQSCLVTALPQSDGVVLTIAPVGPVIQPASFQRNPLLPKK